MLKSLKLKNVGPQDELEVEFAERLNIVTGDNGLGKSFLLDIAWWALTRRWPAEVNPRLTSGYAAKPRGAGDAFIEFEVMSLTKAAKHRANYDRQEQAWLGKPGRPSMPGLVIYAQVDGGFSVWDPARNYWKTKGKIDVQDRLPAFVFSPKDVWDGLDHKGRGIVCNGLIADWNNWQSENGYRFGYLKAVVKTLIPEDGGAITIGSPMRIGLDDVRDVPSLRMPYGVEVPIIHASAAIRRIMALSYLVVWAILEHKKACEQTGQALTQQIVILFDEIELHLHPRWQRQIVPALLNVLNFEPHAMKLQVIAATHSPLVLASLETLFDEEKDKWFDIDAEDGKVALEERPFERLGDASKWLMSEAFDLKQAGSIGREQAIEALARLIEDPKADGTQIQALGRQLEEVVSDRDPVWARWRMLAEKKGLQG